MKKIVVLAALLSASSHAFAQQAADPLVQAASGDLQALSTAQGHFVKSVQALIEDRDRLKMELSATKAEVERLKPKADDASAGKKR